MHINPNGALITKIPLKPEPHLRGQGLYNNPLPEPVLLLPPSHFLLVKTSVSQMEWTSVI